MTVALVTDSTAYLPVDLLSEHGIRVVPLHVRVGDTEFDEGVDITTAALAKALRKFTRVTTSRPSPSAFLAAYRDAAADGATGVVSVHISSLMSGTSDSATIASHDSPIPVRVVDSRTMGMAMGFAVLSAVGGAELGLGVDEVAAIAERRAEAASVMFYVDTLEYLRRGGRIGAASRLLGSALAIKPLLALRDGQIQPVEKVRTAARALSRLEEMAASAAAAATTVDVAVHHLDAATRAGDLADRLGARLPNAAQVLLVEMGAVVGAHVGPGTIAVVVSPPAGGRHLGMTVQSGLLLVGAALVGFVVGSVNPATITARILRIDLTTQGSGNPGATNAGRVLGVRYGILVGAADVAKGMLPTLVALEALGRVTAYVVGLACVLGHVLSPFLRGRGGKGVATSMGAIAAVLPWFALVVVVVFAATVGVTHWVAKSSLVAAGTLALLAGFAPVPEPVVAGRLWALTLAVLVVVRHQQNIRGWVRRRLR